MNDPMVWPKTCHCCGTSFDEKAWDELPIRGVQMCTSADDFNLELRNCNRCNSTLTVPLPNDFDASG